MSGENRLTERELADLTMSLCRSQAHVAHWRIALQHLYRNANRAELHNFYVEVWEFRQLLTVTLRRLSKTGIRLNHDSDSGDDNKGDGG